MKNGCTTLSSNYFTHFFFKTFISRLLFWFIVSLYSVKDRLMDIHETCCSIIFCLFFLINSELFNFSLHWVTISNLSLLFYTLNSPHNFRPFMSWWESQEVKTRYKIYFNLQNQKKRNIKLSTETNHTSECCETTSANVLIDKYDNSNNRFLLILRDCENRVSIFIISSEKKIYTLSSRIRAMLKQKDVVFFFFYQFF